MELPLYRAKDHTNKKSLKKVFGKAPKLCCSVMTQTCSVKELQRKRTQVNLPCLLEGAPLNGVCTHEELQFRIIHRNEICIFVCISEEPLIVYNTC